MDGFWSKRCLNYPIDVPDKIGSNGSNFDFHMTNYILYQQQTQIIYEVVFDLGQLQTKKNLKCRTLLPVPKVSSLIPIINSLHLCRSKISFYKLGGAMGKGGGSALATCVCCGKYIILTVFTIINFLNCYKMANKFQKIKKTYIRRPQIKKFYKQTPKNFQKSKNIYKEASIQKVL